MRLLTIILLFILVCLLLADVEAVFRRKRKISGISTKLKFWQRKEDKDDEKPKKTWLLRLKERWGKIKKWFKSKTKPKMVREKLQSYYPKYFLEKIQSGKKLLQSEIDELKAKLMRKNRKEMTVTDMIYSINRGNDVILKEIDIVERDDAPKVVQAGKKRKRRDAMRERYYLWQNRIVPYEIDGALESDRSIIEKALNGIASKTCIKFVPKKSEIDWIKFVKKVGCFSTVGKVFWEPGFQEISLGDGCMQEGTIQHEVMHALGFYHEQSRPDRDQYVEIFWDNIKNGLDDNFEKKEFGETDTLNFQYDFGSIMHYGKYTFAMDPSKPTIQSKSNPYQSLGQRDSMSPTDIQQINNLYSCSVTNGAWSSWSTYGPCSEDCFKERSRFCMDTYDKTSCSNPTSTLYLQYGVDLQRVRCDATECANVIDGNWGQWSEWGTCSALCGKGSYSRSRTCSDPAPKYGGRECLGSSTETQECMIQKCDSGAVDCTFDVKSSPLCTWSDESLNLKWRHHSGSTASPSTGPLSDHTSGYGSYIYIETSSPAQLGWKARLKSPSLSPQARCLKFWYHMYGVGMGTLNVKVLNIITSRESQVFSKSGDQLNKWREAQITVSASNNYRIIFEGIRGNNFQSDIALDDIEVTDVACATVTPTGKPSVPTFSSVGCYHDYGFINNQPPFPLYTDLSDQKVSTANLDELKTHFDDIVNYCASLARSNGFKYFAIQQYYQCWTGETSAINYGRDGESAGCWPEAQMNVGPYLVGQYWSNMVYRWDDM